MEEKEARSTINNGEKSYNCRCGSYKLQLLSVTANVKNRKYIVRLVCQDCGLPQWIDLPMNPIQDFAKEGTDQTIKKSYIY